LIVVDSSSTTTVFDPQSGKILTTQAEVAPPPK
jgi:hypothetical protein